MQNQIIVLGKIGNTEFQNNDRCKVTSRFGISKAIYSVACNGNAPLVLRKWRKRLFK